jgi:NADH:ubiquinone oxidoreductase subunit 6 (subunit J)
VAEIGDRLGRYAVFAWLAVIALGVQGVFVLANSNLPGLRDDPKTVGDIGSPQAIGHSFLDTYIVPFEATSLALLVAAVGAVLLAKRAVRSEGGR